MNLIDAYVTNIIGEPYEAYGNWWLKVEANSYGQISPSTLMFTNKSEAEKIEIGHHFLT